MNHWQATFLGLKQLPRELSGFEIEAFFTFTASERAVIEARRSPSLKLGLALQIGFLRMSGRLLDAVRIVPPALWKHLGCQFGEQAPDLASLRERFAPNPASVPTINVAFVALSSYDELAAVCIVSPTSNQEAVA